MDSSSVPWFVLAICYGAGALLIALGVPLLRGRVAPNWTYGVRFASTMADERVWYPINARGGRDIIIIGILYIVVQTLALVFGDRWTVEVKVLGPLALLVIALIIDAIVLGVAAGRLHATLRGHKHPGAPS